MANLVHHVQSGNYYARIRVRGKLIWKSLKTDRISVARLRLNDFHKEERQRAAASKSVARGKMTFGDALAAYKLQRENDLGCLDWMRSLKFIAFLVGDPASSASRYEETEKPLACIKKPDMNIAPQSGRF